MMLAVANNQLDAATILLRHGANVNQQPTQTGMAPIHVAVQYGHFESTKLLIRHRAGVNQKSTQVFVCPFQIILSFFLHTEIKSLE